MKKKWSLFVHFSHSHLSTQCPSPNNFLTLTIITNFLSSKFYFKPPPNNTTHTLKHYQIPWWNPLRTVPWGGERNPLRAVPWGGETPFLPSIGIVCLISWGWEGGKEGWEVEGLTQEKKKHAGERTTEVICIRNFVFLICQLSFFLDMSRNITEIRKENSIRQQYIWNEWVTIDEMSELPYSILMPAEKWKSAKSFRF